MKVEILIKKIFDKSKEVDVDLKVACAQVREDLRTANELTPEVKANLVAADKLASDYYEELCKLYAETGFEGFDAEAFKKDVAKKG